MDKKCGKNEAKQKEVRQDMSSVSMGESFLKNFKYGSDLYFCKFTLESMLGTGDWGGGEGEQGGVLENREIS
jgi:hypothetical protein